MNTDNRIDIIGGIRDEAGRADAYRKLDHETATKSADPLGEAEVDALYQNLPYEISAQALAFMWRLLINAPRREKIKSLALSCLNDAGYPQRGFAMLYLRVHYPELMPRLAELFWHDPEPEVRYELTEYVAATDPAKAVHMKIDLLPCDSHELYDALIIEISEMGDERHLARLRRRQSESGEAVFGVIADAIEARLKAEE